MLKFTFYSKWLGNAPNNSCEWNWCLVQAQLFDLFLGKFALFFSPRYFFLLLEVSDFLVLSVDFLPRNKTSLEYTNFVENKTLPCLIAVENKCRRISIQIGTSDTKRTEILIPGSHIIIGKRLARYTLEIFIKCFSIIVLTQSRVIESILSKVAKNDSNIFIAAPAWASYV